MGASITAYWPGITEEQLDGQPGFWNDDRAWSNFIVEQEEEPEVKQVVVTLAVEPILTFTTDGMSNEEVYWVTPDQLYSAADRLESAVQLSRPGVERILTVYERNANMVDRVEDEFMRDLQDIKAIARWAEQEGASVMTLAVNW